MPYTLIIHGGAGPSPKKDYSQQAAHMRDLIETGGRMLAGGGTALDVVVEMVAALEESGLYVAGRGTAPNGDGIVELDASLMEGHTRRAGAVAAIRDVVNPVRAARLVMDRSPHVMMAGEGARTFTLAEGGEPVEDVHSYYTYHRLHQSGRPSHGSAHGTVGAVALDDNGNLAAATSTGGTFGKLPGRVGDTPIIGSGTWADDTVAVSCTGIGETFIRASAASDVSARMRYAGESIEQACRNMLDTVSDLKGDGGVIAVGRDGSYAMPFNSHGMKRAMISDTSPAVVRVFEPEPLQS